MHKVLALSLLLVPFTLGESNVEALEESNVEAHLKPKHVPKLKVKDHGKAQAPAQLNHKGKPASRMCAYDDKEVPRSSNGPRKVKYDDTKEAGYFSKPKLHKIVFLNQEFDEHRRKKMESALSATLKHTAAGNESTVEVERYKAFIPKDIQKEKHQEHTMKLKRMSSGNFDVKAGADMKVVAIYLTWASLLEKIAKEVTNTTADFKNVYFLLEDDVSFGDRDISDWADQVMCHVSKLPADWDIYKFGSWGESLARRKDDTCGHAHAFNDHSCQLKLLQGEDQWEWMGNMGLAIRPRGAANMLKYLKTKQVMDVDGAMLPTSWSNMRYAPNYYASRTNLVWHKSPINGRSGFLEREHTQTTNEKTNLLTPRRLKKGQMEVWYVNLDESHQRKQCVEGQLKKQFIEPHRFPAVKYPTQCGANGKSAANKNCFRKEFSDCMDGGINWLAVSSHGTAGATAGSVQKGVIANWCSHKRMFDLLAKDNKTTEEKYYVLLEDDVILSPKFRLGLENFIATYPKQWKYIQVDPFGAEGRQVAFHNGRVTEPGAKGEKFPGDNYGMHCLVVKQSALPDIHEYFSKHEVIPIDWIAKDMPGLITWAGNIAQNPEGHNGLEFQKPAMCSDAIYKSNIAGLKEDNGKKKR